MRRLVGGIAGALVLVTVPAWLFAPETLGAIPRARYSPLPASDWRLPADIAAAVRADALRRAQVRFEHSARLTPEDVAFSMANPVPAPALSDPVLCRYLYDEPSGTSSKFDCVLESGHVIKVKYGRNPEVHAETAASTLLTTLGYAADQVQIIPRLRCYGCPRYPFLMARFLWLVNMPDPLDPDGYDRGYTDFDWVSVESRFDAPAIETEDIEGWGWYELSRSDASRGDLDAFRLLAAFLAHWDNKSDNQRLVCLDEGPAPPDGFCERPLLMIQDLGATFGPVKVNLSGWRNRPVWLDRRECLVTMRDLPWQGATYGDVQISEAGRAQLAQALAALSDEDTQRMFFDARFHEFYTATDDEQDLEAWTAAFHSRVDQILTAGPCPDR